MEIKNTTKPRIAGIGAFGATFLAAALLAASLIRKRCRPQNKCKQVELERLHLAAIVDSTSGSIISLTKDLDGTIQTWNRGAMRIYGYSPQEAIGRNINFLIPSGYPDDTVWIMETIRNGGVIEAHETLRKNKRGEILNISVTVSPIRDAEGTIIGASAIGIDTTALKKAEEKLRETEARFSAFMDHLPAAAWIKDLDGRYVYANEEASRVFMTPIPDLLGKSDDDIFPSETAQQFKKNDRRVLNEQKKIRVFEHLREENGEVHTSIVSKFAIPGPDGVPTEVAGVAFDVTDLKRTEERLRISEETYRTLYQDNPTMIFTLDTDWKILSANPACSLHLGFALEEMVGRPALEFFHEEDRPLLVGQLQNCLANPQQVYNWQFRKIRNDGAAVWVEETAQAVQSFSGDMNLLIVCQDISDRMRVEERLRESEAQFRQLAEALPQLVWINNADGRDIYLNRKWYDYTGATLEDVNDLDRLAALIFTDDYERASTLWQRCLESGEPFETEYRLRRASDGEYRWFLARALPIRDEKGEITRWFGTCTDIEEQRRARDAAEAAARVKADFMANMSHEIRTPMNGIIGITDLLLDTPLSDLQHHYLDMVKDSAESLLSVINHILDFSKIEAGASTLEHIEFDLRETVAKATESLAIRAFQKGLELAVDVESGIPNFLVGDPTKLRQVLMNLVGNAVKFTEKGEVSIHVSGVLAEERKWRFTFLIHDTGIGIPEGKLGDLFRSFSQVDASTSRAYGGTGLGLAISKRIVEMMGGNIFVESRLGGGSTFGFQVELLQGSRVADVQPVDDLAGRSCLVIDDNKTNRLMIQRSLEEKKLFVETSPSGGDGIEKTSQSFDSGRPYDFILIDIHLPDMDGFQVVEKLSDRLQKNALIMMITSDDLAAGSKRAQDMGIAYIVKPVWISALLETLVDVRMSQQRGIRRQTVEQPSSPLPEIPACTHVLIAEDNPVNLTVTEAMLRKAGARISAATNGIEAIDAYEHGRFNVILMDVQMPEMDGFEATRVLRAKGADVPIIGLTAHAMAEDKEKCIAAGMDDYLAKPVAADALREKVSYWARQHPQPAADIESIMKKFDVGREGLGIVVGTFLQSAPQQLADIGKAVDAGDAVAVEKASHRLKGALAVVVAETARCLAEEIETAGKSGELSEARKLFSQLVAEMMRVMEDLAKP